MNHTLDIIKKRRSIYTKMFSGEIIDDEIIEQLLEAANWAPTHKLTQPWRFSVFSGAGLSKLAAFQSELYQKVANSNGKFDQMVFEKLKNNPHKCSHVISIGVNISGKVPEIEETNAVACAVQNILLAANELDVAGYWGSGGITYFEEAKTFFELDSKDKLMGFLYLGKYNGEMPPGKRSSISEKVSWVK